jgi:hypothetical protein
MCHPVSTVFRGFSGETAGLIAQVWTVVFEMQFKEFNRFKNSKKRDFLLESLESLNFLNSLNDSGNDCRGW